MEPRCSTPKAFQFPMKPKLRAFTTSVVALLGFCTLTATEVFAADPVLTRLIGDVLWAPQPAYGSDQQIHLVYELRLANPSSTAINLTKVEVIDTTTGKTLLEADHDYLARRLSIGGRRGAEVRDIDRSRVDRARRRGRARARRLG